MFKEIVKEVARVRTKEALSGSRTVGAGDEKVMNNGQGGKLTGANTMKGVMT